MVTEAGGYLWLLEGGDQADGSGVVRLDVESGEAVPVALPGGLLSMEESGGSLWVTSITDHVVTRIDPETLEFAGYPLPGKPGGMVDTAGSLWIPLYHPGALLRMDPDAELLPEADRVVDQTVDGHRLLCTVGGLDDEAVTSLRTDPGSYDGPATVILDAMGWIGYGSWSVVQAMLAEDGVMTCSHGYVGRESIPPPDERAADLADGVGDCGARRAVPAGGQRRRRPLDPAVRRLRGGCHRHGAGRPDADRLPGLPRRRGARPERPPALVRTSTRRRPMLLATSARRRWW